MKLAKLFSILAIVMLSYSCSTDSVDEKIEAEIASFVPPTKQIEIEIMELINNHRISLGLDALSPLDKIKAEAYTHTDYMVRTEDISHANFYQRRTNLVNSVGAKTVGENIAYAYSSPQSVVNAWIASEGHKTVLEGDFTDFDISAEKDADDKWYFTNIFVKR
jgi:uncharacterized protein YkwD